MKHKAQESLDLISRANCSYLKEYEHKCSTIKCKDCEWCQALNILENSINCQLTVEEMKFIANCLYVAGFVDENMVKQILGKFQKQKEMWVSDDE